MDRALRVWVRGDGEWATIGRQYLDALLLTTLPVRAITSTPANLNEPVWIGLDHLFRVAMPEKIINVVIGFGDEFQRLYTDNCDNVAITGCVPRPPNGSECASLRKYKVCVTDPAYLQPFVNASLLVYAVLPPEPSRLQQFFEKLVNLC